MGRRGKKVTEWPEREVELCERHSVSRLEFENIRRCVRTNQRTRMALFKIIGDQEFDKGEHGARYDPKNTPIYVYLLRCYYMDRPFDMIWDGCFMIATTEGELIQFIPNEEQARMLRYIETRYYAKQVVKIIVLKCRRMGISTFSMVIPYILTSQTSYKKAHLITHKRDTAESLLCMFRNFYAHLPDKMKPKTPKKKQQVRDRV
jgi:hypothetical protein